MAVIPAKYAELVLSYTKDESDDDLLTDAVNASLFDLHSSFVELAEYHKCTVAQLVKAILILNLCEAEEMGHISHELAGKPTFS